MKTEFKRAAPYADDALNLPVANVDAAIPFYEKTFGFTVESREESPVRRVVLARDDVRIGLAENGGDPSQEGCFFEVTDVDAAFEEVKGCAPTEEDIEVHEYGTAAIPGLLRRRARRPLLHARPAPEMSRAVDTAGEFAENCRLERSGAPPVRGKGARLPPNLVRPQPEPSSGLK